jgi:hypothetical protein
MVKTRTQTANITIKKEEEQDFKPILVLHSVRIVPRSSDKLTKQKSCQSKRNILSVQEIKVEQDIDVKSLLGTSSTLSRLEKRHYISQEQINQHIDYVVNHGISVNKASFKVNTNYPTTCYYYNVYKSDPEKKIPVPLQKRIGDKKIYPGTNNKAN